MLLGLKYLIENPIQNFHLFSIIINLTHLFFLNLHVFNSNFDPSLLSHLLKYHQI